MLKLASFVWQAFGGASIRGDELDKKTQKVVVPLKKAGDGVVSLGDMIKNGVGVCRHCSILFKYLCDHTCRFPAQWGHTASTALPCQLIRGVVPGSGALKFENHMWNVVLIGTRAYIMDVRNSPSALIDLESKQALHYQRLVSDVASDRKVRACVRM